MNDEKLRIMTLGYSGVGKTYFLGSLFKLAFDVTPNGFTVRPKDFTDKNNIETIYQVINDDAEGSIGTTVKTQHANMVLKRGIDTLFNLQITDIEGQALQPGQSIETAREIQGMISNYDGLILIIKAPRDAKECMKYKNQLAQMLDFAGILLSKNTNVPIALVINQIDALPHLIGVKDKIEEELKQLKTELQQKHSKRRQVRQELKARRGEIVNKFVDKAIETDEIDEIVEIFYNWIRNTNAKIANRIFPSTSIGFDNATESSTDVTTFIAKEDLEPYGTLAAFLWVLYARISMGKDDETFASKFLRKLDGKELSEKLIEDIRHIHTSGNAYYSKETPEFIIRNLNNIFTGNE
jgi:GTPase SAR1 family protein